MVATRERKGKDRQGLIDKEGRQFLGQTEMDSEAPNSSKAAGLAVGITVALVLARAASSVLLHVSAADPVVYAGAALFLAAVALWPAICRPGVRHTSTRTFRCARNELHVQ